jgi:hypothetical protein
MPTAKRRNSPKRRRSPKRDVYTKRQAPANALQTNVYRNGQIVGTVTLRGKGNWHWWYGYIPTGLSSHPAGKVRTELGGVKKVIQYDKPATRRAGTSPKRRSPLAYAATAAAGYTVGFLNAARIAGHTIDKHRGQKSPSHGIRRGVIGARGIEPASSFRVEPHRIYALGASDSPDLVYVTSVTPNTIHYKASPFHGKERVIERWIGEDLIAKGTRRWMSTYGRRRPDSPITKSMESSLAGGPGHAANVKGFEPWHVVVVARKPGGHDLWFQAERYGNVAGQEGKGGRMFYEIDTDWERLSKIRRDPHFRIVRSHKRAQAAGASPLRALKRFGRRIGRAFTGKKR